MFAILGPTEFIPKGSNDPGGRPKFSSGGKPAAGATEAARGAADIVLTEAGLSTIVTAIIGARKIFQRMNTYVRPWLAAS